MDAIYHRQVLQRAIGQRVSPRALKAITAANLDQDSLRGLLRPEIHFDNSLFAESLAYIETMRSTAASTAAAAVAWDAFGRLSHTVQDFYSHSNYVALWLEHYPLGEWPATDRIDGLDADYLRHPRLFTGRIYLPLEALCLFPFLQRYVRLLLPHDSHAWVNLDNPQTGPLFPYSIEAAVRRTVVEFERTLAAIGEAGDNDHRAVFLDLPWLPGPKPTDFRRWVRVRTPDSPPGRAIASSAECP